MSSSFPPALIPCFSIMAPATSDSATIWEGLYENEAKLETELQTDGDLVAFLEETQVGDAEDERLSDVIQSFEAEIHSGNVGKEEFILPNSTGGGGGVHGLAEVSEEEPRGPYPTDDPFDWVEMEMASCSIGNEMDQWYLDAFMNELGHMDQFEDQASYVDNFRDQDFYYVDAPMEQDLSPLWEEQVWN